jgi:hypothetical protein
VPSQIRRVISHLFTEMPRGSRKRQRTRLATSEDDVTSMADGANSSPAASRASSPAPTQSVPPLCRRKKFDQRFKVQSKSDEAVLGMFFELLYLAQSQLSNRVLVEAQKATWISSAYEHFHPPTIERVGEVVRYNFRCKRCVLSNPHLIQSDTLIQSSIHHGFSRPA